MRNGTNAIIASASFTPQSATASEIAGIDDPAATTPSSVAGKPMPRHADRPADSQAAGSLVGKPVRTSRLLVSVRDLAEFRLARLAAVDVIDFKEPDHGALAAVDPSLWIEASAEFSRAPATHSKAASPRPQLSAALGEPHDARRLAADVPSSFAFAKAGPSGCRSGRSLRSLWRDVVGKMPQEVGLVAVAYADHSPANCLPPEQILREAAEVGLRRCLIDTFTKQGRSSIEWLGLPRLLRLAELCRELNLAWTLAGSIKLDHLPQLTSQAITPDLIGVRGDVCQHHRGGTLLPARVRQWQDALRDAAS